jgi:hypothetical protein
MIFNTYKTSASCRGFCLQSGWQAVGVQANRAQLMAAGVSHSENRILFRSGSERTILPRGLSDYQGRQKLQGYEIRLY